MARAGTPAKTLLSVLQHAAALTNGTLCRVCQRDEYQRPVAAH